MMAVLTHKETSCVVVGMFADLVCPFSYNIGDTLVTHVSVISLDNDPPPLLGLTDVTCCPCHVCVSLNVTP